MFEEEGSSIKINFTNLINFAKSTSPAKLITKFAKLPKFYWLISLIFVLGFGCLFYGLWSLASISNSAKNPISESTEVSPQEEASNSALFKKIYIDVGGAVKNPGIYELPPGARVSAALEKAGGFSSRASADFISFELNLAKKLSDEEKVYIYSQSEFQNRKRQALILNATSQSNETTGESTKNLISINNASQSELESLEGIGEKRASDIIKARPFSSIDELVTKKILSETLFAQNKNKLAL